jgi:hypothetical protein
MQQHVHTGFVSFMFAGVSALIFLNITRLVAARMVSNGGAWESAGRTIGSLVTFG